MDRNDRLHSFKQLHIGTVQNTFVALLFTKKKQLPKNNCISFIVASRMKLGVLLIKVLQKKKIFNYSQLCLFIFVVVVAVVVVVVEGLLQQV